MTSPANFSAKAMASADLPEAVGPIIATSGRGDDWMKSFAGADEGMAWVSAGVIGTIKSVSNNGSGDRERTARLRRASRRLELGGASLRVAQGKIVQKDETQLDEWAAEGRRQRLKGRGRTNRGVCGAIQRLLTRRALLRRIGVRHDTIAHNFES